MKRKSLILASLAVVAMCGLLLTTAGAQQDPCFPASITVPGAQSRAALEGSDVPGTWTFTVESVKGSISKIEIQIYENALPTSGADKDLYVVCSSNPDSFGRPQADCGAGVPPGQLIQTGSLSIKRVKRGASGSLTLDEGVYCVRPLAFGKGEVTIGISFLP